MCAIDRLLALSNMVAHETALRVVYGVVGAGLLLWGALFQGLFTGGFITACAFRFTTSNDFRTGAGTDDIGWNLPLFDPTANSFTASVLLAVALGVEGLYLFLVAVISSAWEQQLEEINVKANRQRWIRWGLTDPLYLAVVAYTAGITNNALISAYAVAAIGLNFAQAYNETSNSGVIDQNTGDVTTAAGATSAANPWENVPRIDGWIVATLIFVWAAVVWYVYMINGNDVNVNGAVIAIPIVWGALYLILHLLIFGLLTNYQWGWTKGWTYRREYFFIIFRLAMILYVSITLTLQNTSPSCPS